MWSFLCAALLAATPTEAIFVTDPVVGVDDHAARDAAIVLSRGIAARVSARSGLPVTTAADVRALADLEANRLASGCSDDDSACLAEIAAAAGARYVVSSELRRLDERWVLQSTLTDVSQARPLGRSEARADSLADLEGAVPAAVDTLLGPLATIPLGPSATFITGASLLGVGSVVGAGLSAWALLLELQLQDTTLAGADKQFAFDQGPLVLGGAVVGGAVAVVGAGLIVIDAVGGP